MLSRAISSVLAQTFPDFELIVIDDGSPDENELRELCESFDDPRIIFVRQANGGGGAARNAGIDLASGDYIALLDSDDEFVPDKLEICHGVLSTSSQCVDLLYSAAIVLRDRGSWIRPSRGISKNERVANYLFLRNEFIQTSTMVVRAPLCKQVRFDGSLRKGQDIDFAVRLDQSGANIHFLSQPLTIWHDDHSDNRVSHASGVEPLFSWLSKHEKYLTKEEFNGYQGSILAYHLFSHNPVKSLFYVSRLLFLPGVPKKVAFRQLVRCIMPSYLYRKLVALVVSLLNFFRRNA